MSDHRNRHPDLLCSMDADTANATPDTVRVGVPMSMTRAGGFGIVLVVLAGLRAAAAQPGDVAGA